MKLVLARTATLTITLLAWAACSGGDEMMLPDVRAPDRFGVRLDTTKGPLVLVVERALAPRGADRFHTLVRARYFDDSRFFRVVPGKWAQFGIAGVPKLSSAWRSRTFPDDPPRASNVAGAVAFAFAEKDGRSTQVFINLADNSATLDAQGFAPFARVVQGMDVVLALNGEYGETSGGGIRAGKQDPMFTEGNAWLDREFPRLDRIIRASVQAAPLMLTHHQRMFVFDHWCNMVSLGAVAPNAERVPRSLAWLNHILGAKRIWLARVTGTSAPFSVNPTFSATDLREQFEIARDGWARYLEAQSDADVSRLIAYTNLKGEPFQSALGDILAHVPVHGQHHRGQVNADLRAAGLIPPVIDYIHAARAGFLE